MPNSAPNNLILFAGFLPDHTFRGIKQYCKETKQKYRIGLICDSIDTLKGVTQKLIPDLDVVIECNTHSPIAIQKALLPYRHELVAITCAGEVNIPMFTRIIPHVPYLKTPTTESLTWATDKIWMRRRFTIHNKKITPRFVTVPDTTEASIQKIEQKVGYPLIVKPSGLAASKLVSICYHREELEKVLRKIFREIKGAYKKNGGRWDPRILVEQFMEGKMYSIDVYISSRGKVYYCPLVHVVTGRSIGFDDFFGYQRLTPTKLNKHEVAKAQEVARQAVHALGLRSTTAHIELMKTEDGWKIIELGPRMGGFRHRMYELSFGINHSMNDILIRIPQKPQVPAKVQGHTGVLQFFANKEGVLTKLGGIKKAQRLTSFKDIAIHKKIGSRCRFAKNGGSSVFDITLFNEDKSKLLADIRRLEQMIKIETSTKTQ